MGVVIAPAAPTAASSADERAYCSSATFSGLTYWNHDSTPAAADWQARTLDWLALADKVCECVAVCGGMWRCVVVCAVVVCGGTAGQHGPCAAGAPLMLLACRRELGRLTSIHCTRLYRYTRP